MTYTLEETTFEAIEEDYNKRLKKTREMIRHELKTQDGRMCSDPMYLVMEQRENSASFVELFFTNREAKYYAEEYNHEHKGELFIYVKSGYRSEGWKLARELMLKEGEK